MPSPIVQVKQGAGSYAPTTNGVDVVPGGGGLTVALIDPSADSWAMTCITTDETSDAATVQATVVVDSATKTATLTEPSLEGVAWRFKSVVNGGIGPDGIRDDSLTTTFGIFTPVGDKRVGAVDETTEGHATFGYTTKINALIRGSATYGVATTDATTTRIRRIPVAPNTAKAIRAIVTVYSADALVYGTYEVKATYTRPAGVLGAVDGPTVTTVVESDAGLDVTVTPNGNTDVDINVVGLVATNLTWKLTELTL